MKTDDFETANQAFALFTLDERRLALQEFAGLKYPNIEDRFVEAVHRVICRITAPVPIRVPK